MYWPCGVPRIYAHEGLETYGGDEQLAEKKNDATDTDLQTKAADGKQPTEPSPSRWVPCGILDLQIARLDHLFVTISRNSLTTWSSRVSLCFLRTGILLTGTSPQPSSPG